MELLPEAPFQLDFPLHLSDFKKHRAEKYRDARGVPQSELRGMLIFSLFPGLTLLACDGYHTAGEFLSLCCPAV